MKLENLISELKTMKVDYKTLLTLIGGFSASDLVLKGNMEIDKPCYEKIMDAAKRNQEGFPLAYITGQRAFYRDVFKVNSNVLIPQPDTETLVEEAVSYLKTLKCSKVSILDLCAGSGCIGISIAKEICPCFEKIDLYLSDISSESVKCFSENAKLLISCKNTALHFIESNMFDNIPEKKFSLIVSNPPYIPSSVISTLSREVQNEPLIALDGGKDGLDFYRIITQKAKLFLEEKAYLMVEIGYDQGLSVKELFAENSFENVQVIRDLNNNDRVVKGSIK